MGQKINPVSIRLQTTNRSFDNCWYSNYFYRKLINKDLFLQRYLNNFLKLLKLPTGRYSVHHLQKKTQIYSFLCYSKTTRLWKSKLFELNKKKKIIKKSRYFLQNKIKNNLKFNLIKRKHKKINQNSFYNSINQDQIYKIQKKISSFQNLQLWSALQQKKLKQDSINKLKNLSRFLSLKFLQTSSLNNLLFNYTNLNKNQLFIQHNVNQSRILHVKDNHLLITKSLNKLSDSLYFLPNNSKTLFVGNKIQDKQNGFSENLNLPFLDKTTMETNLIFLQNLLVYKSIKSQLNKKKNDFKTKGLMSFERNLFNFGKIHFSKLNQNQENCRSLFNTLESKYKNYLESFLACFYELDIDVIPFKVKNDWQHAHYLAEEIVYFLEKRIPFRRLKGKILKQLLQIESIRGVRISCSGRVGGKSKKAQRSKTECLKYGQTSLQVFSSRVDFSFKTAFTSFGSVGVKVWICYN